jgi:hypothetical protein
VLDFEISKIEETTKSWAIIFYVVDRKIIIPIIAIKIFIETVLLFAIVGWAYNTGQQAAIEQIKLMAYVEEKGIYNPETGMNYKCWLVQKGLYVGFDCESNITVKEDFGRWNMDSNLNFSVNKT